MRMLALSRRAGRNFRMALRRLSTNNMDEIATETEDLEERTKISPDTINLYRFKEREERDMKKLSDPGTTMGEAESIVKETRERIYDMKNDIISSYFDMEYAEKLKKNPGFTGLHNKQPPKQVMPEGQHPKEPKEPASAMRYLRLKYPLFVTKLTRKTKVKKDENLEDYLKKELWKRYRWKGNVKHILEDQFTQSFRTQDIMNPKDAKTEGERLLELAHPYVEPFDLSEYEWPVIKNPVHKEVFDEYKPIILEHIGYNNKAKKEAFERLAAILNRDYSKYEPQIPDEYTPFAKPAFNNSPRRIVGDFEPPLDHEAIKEELEMLRRGFRNDEYEDDGSAYAK